MRPSFIDLFAIFLLSVLAAVSPRTATASKPFTPELMLQNQDVGEVRFSADGTRVYLERLLPYRDKGHFDRVRDWGRSLSVLSIVDVATGRTRLLRRSPQDRTWYLGDSPDARYLAFGWFDGGVQRLGLLDQRTGRERRLPLAASTWPYPVVWLSDHELISVSMDPELQSRTMAGQSHALRRIADWSQRTWRGEASVKVVGSGRYGSPPNERPVDLVRVDARSGQTRRIDSGTIGMVLEPAPTGQRVAYLRKTGAFPMAGAKVKAITDIEAINELTIYDLEHGRQAVPVCETCSVDAGTLRWAPGGRQLYFSARYRDGDGFGHRHYIYDAQSGEVAPFRIPGLAFSIEDERDSFLAPLLWLDETHLAVRTRNTDAGQFDDQDFRWYLVQRDGAVLRELTLGLERGDDKQAFKQPVAVRDAALLMVADGQLWRLPVRGEPRNLTASLGGDVEAWCAPLAPWRTVRPRCDALRSDSVVPPIDGAALQEGRLALRLMREDAFTGEFAFLDLASGTVEKLERPTPESEPLEASGLANAVVFQRKGADGDEVLLVREGADVASVYRFNAHLAGVGRARPVLLTRREPGEDEDRNDWLLLPPDHHPGQRHPLLVYFYPDTRYGKELLGDDLRDISFLNKNIPTARGYAVLLASMKISDYGTDGGNPMREMHEQLIRAAENAVAEGYVDSERWAIMGHSYGGYGTNSVITQTERFKAAISMDGLANLTSAYAIGMNSRKAFDVPEGLNFGALWSEGGQGRMGVPPWRDPQRYIDNSPLFWAHRIETPLMLIHGDLDFVNINEAEQLFTAMHRQGKDTQLVRYWGEDHIYLSPGNIVDMWDRIFAFLGECLGTEATAAGTH